MHVKAIRTGGVSAPPLKNSAPPAPHPMTTARPTRLLHAESCHIWEFQRSKTREYYEGTKGLYRTTLSTRALVNCQDYPAIAARICPALHLLYDSCGVVPIVSQKTHQHLAFRAIPRPVPEAKPNPVNDQVPSLPQEVFRRKDSPICSPATLPNQPTPALKHSTGTSQIL
jgi:hypothetical protein